MDGLDMRILRELGMEPFVGWAHRPPGFKIAAVARSLHVGEQLVKERIARMTERGAIRGYVLRPNLRHIGESITVYHLRHGTVPDQAQMERLAEVDGFTNVVWSFDSGLCIDVRHGTPEEGRRRIRLVGRLVDDDRQPKVLYHIDFPPVERALTDLDWRIIAALTEDAKRPIPEVANELGVTAKTVRTRLNQMREEGSVDEHVEVDLSLFEGIIPFQLALWCPESMEAALLDRYKDRYLAHFRPSGDDAYCPLLFRIFAFTPAEVQALVREALDIDGVEHAEAMVATGGWSNPDWLRDMLAARAPLTVP